MSRWIFNAFIITSSISFCYAVDIRNKDLIEDDQCDTLYKCVSFKKVVESLDDYQKAKNEYKLYIDDKQKYLAETADKIRKDSDSLESHWAAKKSEMSQIKDYNEYKDEYKREEDDYLEKKRVLEEQYGLFIRQQEAMEAAARVKYKELFNPVEKKARKLIDEFIKNLEEKISDFNSKHNRRPVKIICFDSDSVVNFRKAMDITDDVLEYIKSKNISIDTSDDVSNNLKNNKKTKK